MSGAKSVGAATEVVEEDKKDSGDTDEGRRMSSVAAAE